MEKFIPYEKLSKKKRRELDLEKRGSWGEINPVTRKGENPKAYNRRKTRSWKEEFRERVFSRLYAKNAGVKSIIASINPVICC